MAPRFIAEAWPEAREQALTACPQLPPSVHTILICGCGDSHHAAASLEFALAASTRRQVRAAPSLTAGRHLLPRHLKDPARLLLIALSASGEVARTLEAVELARQAGAHTLALTTQPESSLARVAAATLALSLPELPHGPGLLSYLAALLMGYALAEAWAVEPARDQWTSAIIDLADQLEAWQGGEATAARALAEQVDPAHPVLFLGSGPQSGSAMFAAAKVIEAAGAAAWAQDVEEWAHLEYFCDPADQVVWLLSAAGRATEREEEVMAAAQVLGRRVQLSRWTGAAGYPLRLREAVSPLALWAGPAAFADRLAQRLGQLPFRGFAGGRDRQEGGGASRIRSSARWSRLDFGSDWEG